MSSDKPTTGAQVIKFVLDRLANRTEGMVLAMSLTTVADFDREGMRAAVVDQALAIVLVDGDGARRSQAVVCMDLEAVRAAIGNRTIAVLPVNLGDHEAELVELGDERGLIVTEDRDLEYGTDVLAEFLAAWPEITVTSFWTWD